MTNEENEKYVEYGIQEAINELIKNGHVEISGIDEEGEFLYPATSKGLDTVQQMEESQEQEYDSYEYRVVQIGDQFALAVIYYKDGEMCAADPIADFMFSTFEGLRDDMFSLMSAFTLETLTLTPVEDGPTDETV